MKEPDNNTLIWVPTQVFMWLLIHALNSLPDGTWDGPVTDDSDTEAICEAFCCPHCCGPCAALLELSCAPINQQMLGEAIRVTYGPGDGFFWQNPDGTINWDYVQSKWVTPDGTYPMQKLFNCHTITEDGEHVHNPDDDDDESA